MNNNFRDTAIAQDAYAKQDPYAKRDPYANKNDPYANKNDPYAKKQEEKREKEARKHWALDFEIIRFFRENFNSAIDAEETHRAFFDEEYMFNLRLKLLKRNFLVIVIKFIIMALFSVVTLFLPIKVIAYVGLVYIFFFVYLVAVPIGFSKYARQYIIDDTETGKLKKVHETYTRWINPLETITVNFYTFLFMAIEGVMFFKVDEIHHFIVTKTAFIHNAYFQSYIKNISSADLLNSIIFAFVFYFAAFLTYKLFVYYLLVPKFEKKREENEKLYRRGFQRTAQNLQDELTKEI